MMAHPQLTKQEQTAASLLGDAHFSGRISREDFDAWEQRHLLLLIGDAVERSHGSVIEFLPREMRQRYATVRQAAAAVDAGERYVIAQVLTTLRSAGVASLLLKGAALAYTIYPAPWLRPRADIDVMVPAGTMPQVMNALSCIGFEPVREVTHPLITRQRHFVRSAGFRVAIDVHEALANPLVLRTLPSFDVLNARSQQVPAISPHAYALGPADALMHALVHRVAHHNSSVDLLWLYDMHLLAQQMTARAWEQFVETCVQSRVCRIAADGLHVLAGVLHSPVPSDVIARLDAVQGEPSAALLGGGLTELRLQWINFKSLPDIGTRLEFARAHLAPPPTDVTFGDRARWQLPLRYLSRVVRGTRKWFQPISRGRAGN